MSRQLEQNRSVREIPQVICAQVGARDHYAFARAFQRMGALEALVTDYWHRGVPWIPGCIGNRMVGRRHPELDSSHVSDQGMRSLVRELQYRFRGTSGWERIRARNRAFQAAADQALGRIAHRLPVDNTTVLFSYSYAAEHIFRSAKRRGWKTLLGQIDPGPIEGRLVDRLVGVWPEYPVGKRKPPEQYYDAWREELELADRIVVNSDWSRDGLLEEGVDPQKLTVVPIPYESEYDPRKRRVPEEFCDKRPLRLLFLGQVNLRKGVPELLEAMCALRQEPVELAVVGGLDFVVPDRIRDLVSVNWHGQVPRGEAHHFFDAADLFVLPTHSDGFGLTQVEALSHGIPVLTTPFCASIVRDGFNGRVLPETSVGAIESAIRGVLENPLILAEWSGNCHVPEKCQMGQVVGDLEGILRTLTT